MAGTLDMTHVSTHVWRLFLERTPPNVAKTIVGLGTMSPSGSPALGSLVRFPSPPLELHCQKCGGERWFDCAKEASPVGFAFLSYRCRNCTSFSVTFALLVRSLPEPRTTLEVMKLGQFPPFAAPISKRIEALLNVDNLELYRQGTRAEAQGLGIGAASYFRRVVDNYWKKLVSEVRDAAVTLGVSDVSVYEAALQEKQFSKAVEMLGDAIPEKLRILDGKNPLTLLYKAISVQLHDLDDAQCLDRADSIRRILTALLENIAEVLKDQDGLKKAVEKLNKPATA